MATDAALELVGESRRRPRHRPAGRVGQRITPWSAARWYVLLTLLSLIVLVPIYFLIVRAISIPRRRSRRRC